MQRPSPRNLDKTLRRERRPLPSLRSSLVLGFALALGSVLISPLAHAHGGTYRGPADTLPPDASPGGPGPSTGGGSSGSGPSSSGGGGGGSATSGGGSTSLGGRTTARGPAAPNPASSPDLSAWQLWWGFNQAEFLDVKGAISAMDVLPGSDDAFFGAGPFLRDKLLPSEQQIRKTVVPALLRVLQTERDNDVVTGALVALAKIGDPRGVGQDGRSQTRIADTVRPFLKDPNQEIAETAAVCLGILGDASSVPHLASLLVSDDLGRRLTGKILGVPLRTRAFAAYGLGLIAYRSDDPELARSIARALFGTLEGGARGLSTPDVAVACVSALGLVHLPVEEGFDPAQGADAWSSRQAAVERLGELAGDDAWHDVVRAHVPIAVARLLDGSGLDAARDKIMDRWTTALADESLPIDVLCSIACALGTLGDCDADAGDVRLRATLAAASLRGQNRELRQFALLALARVASRPGAGPEPLSGLADARRRVLRRLTGGGSSIRPWAALALGVIGRNLRDAGLAADLSDDALLLELLDEARAPREVGAYAVAAGMRRIQGAAPILVRKLAEIADDDARGYVALGLGMLGDGAGLAPVQEVVRRSRYRPALLRQAAISLGLLGDKAIVPDLVEMLRGATSLSAQASIAYGLGAIGDCRSVEPLVTMLENTDITPRARAFAAVALGVVADKEPRTWNAKLAIGINYRARTATLTDTQSAGILDIL